LCVAGGGGKELKLELKFHVSGFFFGATYAKLLSMLRVTQQGGGEKPKLKFGFFFNVFL